MWADDFLCCKNWEIFRQYVLLAAAMNEIHMCRICPKCTTSRRDAWPTWWPGGQCAAHWKADDVGVLHWYPILLSVPQLHIIYRQKHFSLLVLKQKVSVQDFHGSGGRTSSGDYLLTLLWFKTVASSCGDQLQVAPPAADLGGQSAFHMWCS